MIALLLILASNAYAAEQIALEPVSAAKQSGSPNPFTMIVSGDGKMIAKPGAVFTDGGDYSGVILPYLISSPKPILYPRWAVRQGWQGKLILAVEIFTDGTVGKYKVMRSTGHKMLDDAATKAIQTWKFYPAIKDGKPYHTCVEIPVLFDLMGE